MSKCVGNCSAVHGFFTNSRMERGANIRAPVPVRGFVFYSWTACPCDAARGFAPGWVTLYVGLKIVSNPLLSIQQGFDTLPVGGEAQQHFVTDDDGRSRHPPHNLRQLAQVFFAGGHVPFVVFHPAPGEEPLRRLAICSGGLGVEDDLFGLPPKEFAEHNPSPHGLRRAAAIQQSICRATSPSGTGSRTRPVFRG